MQPLVRIALLRLLQHRQEHHPVARRRVAPHPAYAGARFPKGGDDAAERRVVVQVEPEARAVDEDEFAGHADVHVPLASPHVVGETDEILERLLHHRVVGRIHLDRTERAVHRHEQLASHLADVAVAAPLADFRHRRREPGASGRHRLRARHAAPPRSALLMALRTRTSLSSAALRSTSNAWSDPMRPNAIAAHARSSGATRRRSSALRPLSSASSCGMPASPASMPYASKYVIFSVRSASLTAFPFTTASTLGSAARWPRVLSVRTAVRRTSRSESSSADSSARSAPGDPISDSACTAPNRRPTLSCDRHLSRWPTAAGVLRSAARRIASTATCSSPAAISLSSSAVLDEASRAAVRSSIVRNSGRCVCLSPERMVPNVSPCSCSNSASRSSCGGTTVASLSAANSCDNTVGLLMSPGRAWSLARWAGRRSPARDTTTDASRNNAATAP